MLADAALRRGKSVTKEDKDDIFKYMEGVRTILKWMDATISRTIMRGVVSAAAAEPEADDIPVMCSMGVQTDPDPVSTPDVTDFKTCVREELAKFKEDVLTSIAASAPKQTYASAAASKPDVRIHTPKTRPALVLESTDPAKKSHKDVLDAWKKDVNFTDVPFAPSRVQTVLQQQSPRGVRDAGAARRSAGQGGRNVHTQRRLCSPETPNAHPERDS